jgi:hypothetical protein
VKLGIKEKRQEKGEDNKKTCRNAMKENREEYMLMGGDKREWQEGQSVENAEKRR